MPAPKRVKKKVVREEVVELIPSSRTGKVGDADAVSVKVYVGGEPMEPFTVDGKTVDFDEGYFVLPEDLEIIKSSFVQRKRATKKKPESEPATLPLPQEETAATAAMTEEL